jgi:hypothetical protein
MLIILYAKIICVIYVEVLWHCIPLGQQQIVLQNLVSLCGITVIYYSDVLEHPHLEFLESKILTWQCVITFSSLFMFHIVKVNLILFAVILVFYFVLISFFCHFFGSFLILVINCLVFLVTTFFCCVVLLLWCLLCISSPFLVSFIYFCHCLKNDKLRNVTSDVQRLLRSRCLPHCHISLV